MAMSNRPACDTIDHVAPIPRPEEPTVIAWWSLPDDATPDEIRLTSLRFHAQYGIRYPFVTKEDLAFLIEQLDAKETKKDKATNKTINKTTRKKEKRARKLAETERDILQNRIDLVHRIIGLKQTAHYADVNIAAIINYALSPDLYEKPVVWDSLLERVDKYTIKRQP